MRLGIRITIFELGDGAFEIRIEDWGLGLGLVIRFRIGIGIMIMIRIGIAD